MDGVQLPQGYNHFEKAVYFLPLSSQKFLVLILPTSEGWYSLQLLVNPLQKNPTYTDTCHTMLTVLPIPDSFIFQQTLCSNADGVKFCPSVSLCSCYTCPRQTRTSDGGFFSLLFPIAYVQAVSQRVTTNFFMPFQWQFRELDFSDLIYQADLICNSFLTQDFLTFSGVQKWNIGLKWVKLASED